MRYLLSLERARRPTEEVDAVWMSAAESGFSTAAEGIELFLAYTYLLKRRVDNNGFNYYSFFLNGNTMELYLGGTDYGAVQQSFVDGASRLETTFGQRDWDPEAMYRKSWAYFEAAKCGNISKVRSFHSCPPPMEPVRATIIRKIESPASISRT